MRSKWLASTYWPVSRSFSRSFARFMKLDISSLSLSRIETRYINKWPIIYNWIESCWNNFRFIRSSICWALRIFSAELCVNIVSWITQLLMAAKLFMQALSAAQITARRQLSPWTQLPIMTNLCERRNTFHGRCVCESACLKIAFVRRSSSVKSCRKLTLDWP